MNEMISDATRRNWKKLNVKDSSGRLASGANKRMSEKRFIPLDYMADRGNLPWLKELLASAHEYGWDAVELLYSLALRLLEEKNIDGRRHVRQILDEYDIRAIPAVRALELPETEPDLLGLVYQALSREGDKNRTGSYYTSQAITTEMIRDLDFSSGRTLLDPCCGSGAFLLAAGDAAPEQLTGIDVDPVAVMIAKFNLLLKYHDREFVPGISCCDYLSGAQKLPFDYIVTNPPWGAVTDCEKLPELKSAESFSYFLVHAYHQLKEGGTLRFLLPESILNVRTHRDVRTFMLEHGNLTAITRCADAFSGVMTSYITIEMRKERAGSAVLYRDRTGGQMISRRNFCRTRNKVFQLLGEKDCRLVEKLQDSCPHTLEGSAWALGIVTGNNKTALLKEPLPGSEPIYTGKELSAYRLKPVVNYIHYDREALQQVAKDEFYRAPEKLVYRFISNNLMFAYDSTGSLFLNSANIMIPKIPGMSIKTVMAFLNSEVYRYLYACLFGEVKVLRGNLEELKFPQITSALNHRMTHLINQILDGDKDAHDQLQDLLYEIFDVNGSERERIQEYGQKRRHR